LAGLFFYVDAVITSVPILKRDVREQIKNVSYINDRITRIKKFRKYLDNIWQQTNFQNPHFKWDEVSLTLGQDIKDIESRLERKH